jgi:hypothetical protein
MAGMRLFFCVYPLNNPMNKSIIDQDKIETILINMNDLEFFRLFISDIYNWKSLVRSVYYVKNLINNLDNYQIKEFIRKDFESLFNYFVLFIKDLITIQK